MDRHYNLDKNGKPLPTGNEEPYLSYEELLGLEPLDTEMDKTQELYNTSEEVENKPLEATIIKDNILTPYNDKIDNNPNLTEEEFLIADTSDGAKYYMSKQIGEHGNRPSRVEPNSPTNIITNTSPISTHK